MSSGPKQIRVGNMGKYYMMDYMHGEYTGTMKGLYLALVQGNILGLEL